MADTRGFFSIIQYCPDLDRQEAANIGVVLCIPRLKYVGVRLSLDNEAPKQRFGKNAFDDGRLTLAKRGLETRLLREGTEWSSPDDLSTFAAREGNNLVVLPPRTMMVRNADTELDELFTRLVYVKPVERRRLRKPDLKSIFEPQLVGVRLERDYCIQLPRIGEMKFPYAFQNGKMNLIYPEAFPFDEGAAEGTAEKLAVRGHVIHNLSMETDQQQKLVVVAAFPDSTTREARDRIQYILNECDTRLVEESELPGFVEEIRTTAH